jgi:hypothetical protein
MCSKVLRIFAATAVLVLAPSFSARADLVLNGSLEDLNGTFVNDMLNYMSLTAGSTTIAGWTVAPATVNEIVWGKTPTGDGYSASNGTFFGDLTGFGSDSPNGAIQQRLQNLIIGQQYAFSMDTYVVGALPIVTVGSQTLLLNTGTTFYVGSTPWTPVTASFTADETNPLLFIGNPVPGQQITFVDNIAVAGPTAVPEPNSFVVAAALGILGIVVHRRTLHLNCNHGPDGRELEAGGSSCADHAAGAATRLAQ